MDSSSVILLAGSMGVASLLLTILYFLHKCLMRETPYQRTFLLDEVDALMFKENDKKAVKKTKNTVRQRVTSKPVEVPEKVASKENSADKAALNAAQIYDVRLTVAPEGASGSSAQTWANGEKAEVKKKNQNVVEKVEKMQHTLTAKPAKKLLEETPEVDSSRQLVSGKAAVVGKDDKLKTKGTEVHVSDVDQQQQQQLEKREDKKNHLKSKEVASSSRPVKELHAAKLGKELEENQELNPQQQTDKKKKNKKSNEEISVTEQKVKVEAASQVASLPIKPVVEEAIVEQRIKATMSAPLQPAANKKRSPKAKASEEFDVAEEVPVISELKQKKTPSVEVQQFNKQQQQQQQQNGNKTSNELDEFKKLINEKDAIIQRDQLQFKSLNEALFQMKKELTAERSRFTELETNVHAVSQKHNEEKQTLLNSLHQKEQQSKQAIQLLQQELQSLKARPNDLSMIMSNLAEENAKLTAEISHAEKQRNEEINQRAKTMDLLNDAVRKLDHLELTNKSLEMKFKQADERARAMEMKQKEASDAVARMEKMYLDLQQEHQRLQMQGQPNLELQNQLRNAKVENEELRALVARLEKETSDLEKELKAAEDASIVSESIQQSQASHVTQVVNGCSDAGLLTRLESQLSEHEKTKMELVDKLNVTDKKNQTLEEERGELLIALEKLKKQVVDLERELENKTIPNEPVVEQQNGCLETELVGKLEAIITEKEENCKQLQEKLELKDKKNEDLRQKNWSAMEALTESEKRLELTKKEQELQVKDLQNTIAELKSKLSRAEQIPLRVERVSIQQAAPVSRDREASECLEAKVGKTKEGNEDPEIENVKQLKLVAKANEICMTRQEDEIASLTQELLDQKNKNDKLREKNWTIMTSLNLAESKLQELYQKLEQTENQLNKLKDASSLSSSSSDKGSNTNEDVVRKEYTIVNEVNESCHWDMSQLVLDLDSKTAEIEILQSILDQHESSILVLRAENDELREKSLKGGKEIIELLEQKVEHYKKVLSDTESILRTLEASVDAEEKKWKTKVAKLEKEVSALRQKAV